MKLKLWCIGKTAEPWLEEGMQVYLKRLPHYLPFSLEILPDIKQASSLSKAQLIEREGETVLKKLGNKDFLILLDERGKTYRSVEFAKQLNKWQIQGVESVVIIIGGAYGFSEAVYAKAQHQWSLSPLTFSHQMVRLIALEQLYRACSINKGEPYHHE